MIDAHTAVTTKDSDINPADNHVIAREEAAFARAAEADGRVQGGLHFMDWLAISEGLGRLRDRALRDSHSNRPFGKAYTQRYAALKQTHPWAGHYDPATASHACWLYDNSTDVLRWRETLAANQRQAWITPRIVHQHYDRMHKVADKKAVTATTARIGLQDTIISLQAEVDLLRKRGGGGFMPSATVEQLTEAIAASHNAGFLRKLAQTLLTRAEAEARQDAIEESKRAKRKNGGKATDAPALNVPAAAG